MKLVIDSSVVIKWFLPEPLSTEADVILQAYKASKVTLLAPDLINAEIANILWKRHTLFGLALSDAERIFADFQTINITITPISTLAKSAFGIATKTRRTVYDSLYIALSVREQCQFVTADEKLANAIQSNYPDVVFLKNWTI